MTSPTSPDVQADRQQLIELIKDEAVFHGDFILSSGKQASYYVDMRKLTLDHRAAPLVGRVMLDLIAGIPNIASVGGLTLGADPIANAILHQGVASGRDTRRQEWVRQRARLDRCRDHLTFGERGWHDGCHNRLVDRDDQLVGRKLGARLEQPVAAHTAGDGARGLIDLEELDE